MNRKILFTGIFVMCTSMANAAEVQDIQSLVSNVTYCENIIDVLRKNNITEEDIRKVIKKGDDVQLLKNDDAPDFSELLFVLGLILLGANVVRVSAWVLKKCCDEIYGAEED